MFLRALAITLLLAIMPAAAIPSPAPIPVPVVNSSAPDSKIQILNEAEPGAEVDIEKHLIRNKINVVVFFAEW